MLRRCASLLALIAVIAAPAVTSTRFFCRYTGEEIAACAKPGTPTHAVVLADSCCDQRTFRALEGVRLVDEPRQQAPTPIAVDTAPALVAYVVAPVAGQLGRPTAPSAGPPAFIAHRALLI